MTEDGKLRSLTAGAMRSGLLLGPLAAILVPLSPLARLRAIEDARGTDAGLRYLASALPEREAVWWACMCGRHVLSADRPEEERVIVAAQDWVRRPDERARTAMLPLFRAAGPDTAASFIGRAVFRSRLADPASDRAAFSIAHAVRAAGATAPAAGTGGSNTARFRASALDIARGGAGCIAADEAVASADRGSASRASTSRAAP